DSLDAEALASAKAVWLARHPRLIRMMAARPGENPKSWQDFSDMIIEHRIKSKPYRYLRPHTYLVAYNALLRRGAHPNDQPSTGLLALFHIKLSRLFASRHCRVSLYGFTHAGWHHHPWSAEKAMIAEWNWVRYGGAG